MLKNVQEAKFQMVLLPISKVALPAADQKYVSFDAFFTHILMHELMHGLGPHNITVGGGQTTVRQELKETYSAIEEAKADISGLWALQAARRQEQIDPGDRQRRCTRPSWRRRSARSASASTRRTAAASPFSSTTCSTPARSSSARTARFRWTAAKTPEAVTALTREIMTLQAEGDYAKAKDLIERLGVVRPPVQTLLDRLTKVPVDIEPRFVHALEERRKEEGRRKREEGEGKRKSAPSALIKEGRKRITPAIRATGSSRQGDRRLAGTGSIRGAVDRR